MKKITLWTALVAVLGFVSCNSYRGPYGYIGYYSDDVKTSKQFYGSSLTTGLTGTFDDEFTYDEKGNVIEHVQVQYLDEGKKFVEYRVNYQSIGEYVLPKSIAVNGIEYMNVEYDLININREGPIAEYTSSPIYYEEIKNFGSETNIEWSVDIDNFDVPFRKDGKFVTNEANLGIFGGLSLDKALTLGYDNVVLTRFYYSQSAFQAGYQLTFNKDANVDPEKIHNTSVTFDFVWEVIGETLVQKGMTFDQGFDSAYVVNDRTFSISREFDDRGRRTKEVWTLLDDDINKGVPFVVFTQDLTY